VVSSLHSAISALRSIANVLPAAQELTERMDSTYIELKDVAHEVGSCLERIDFDPAELDQINNRLDRLYELQRKYRVETVGELIGLRDDLQQKLAAIENSDDTLQELEAQCAKLQEQCRKLADKLTQKRKTGAQQIEQEMLGRLMPLGMPNVRFAITVEPAEIGATGQDKVQFLFSANTSTPLQPVAQVASGGEIARVMLSLKAMISGAVKLPTIIFDEIDTGVSGRVAEQMARMMQEMGLADRQVISITHLPQIAALGATHYKVTKTESATGTVSNMQELTAEERVTEIAQMLSGSSITAAAIQNAKELLGASKKNK
jgi:DNA repair protein RecN (Recombination protein N)